MDLCCVSRDTDWNTRARPGEGRELLRTWGMWGASSRGHARAESRESWILRKKSFFLDFSFGSNLKLREKLQGNFWTKNIKYHLFRFTSC